MPEFIVRQAAEEFVPELPSAQTVFCDEVKRLLIKPQGHSTKRFNQTAGGLDAFLAKHEFYKAGDGNLFPTVPDELCAAAGVDHMAFINAIRWKELIWLYQYRNDREIVFATNVKTSREELACNRISF